MGPLGSIFVMVLLMVPTLQAKTPSPRTLTSPALETPTSLTVSHLNATTSSENSLHAHTVTKKGKSHNGSEICNKTGEMPCSSFSHKNYNINISDSNPCVFSCYYNPSQLHPLRLEVHQRYEDPLNTPTFVSVQQDRYISSWTLPFTSPARGQNQIFTTLETLLCPPANDTKEIVQISLSVRASGNKTLQIALTNVSFVLQKEVNVSVTVTPVSPWYKRYQWAEKEESVLITAESVHSKSVDTCALLVLQNAKCPVSSEVSGLMNKGRYQTFTKAAGMVARKTDFPDGVHIIVISLPDDDACILNTEETQHDKPRDTRTKTVVLEVYDHATIATTWYIFLMTAVVIFVIAVAASTLICFVIKRTLSASGENDGGCDENDDRRQLLRGHGNGPSFRVMAECGVYSVGGGRQQAPNNNPAGMGNNLPRSGLGQAGEGLDESTEEDGNRGDGTRRLLPIEAPPADAGDIPYNNQGVVVVQPPAYLPPTTYAPTGQALNVSQSFNPQFVLWWKRVAVEEAGTAEAHVAEVGFQNSMVIMGVFAALPYSELLRSYLGLVLHHGQEDQCFWNSRCLTAFGSLPDFARVFTNLGYICLGVAYVFIVRRHKKLMHNILGQYNAGNSVGVSHHYGLFVSLGYGLVMQGVMSAFYHTCPNSVTIKFDMMFMYVILVVAVVSMWGLRHADVTHHVYPTVIAVGLALLVAEGRMWLSRGWFWGLLSTAYVVLLASNAVLMASYGIWSFSLSQMWHVWSGWKELGEELRNVLGEQDTSHRSMKVVRVMVGVFGNVGLIVFGIVVDPNVYNFILIVCLVNMGLYFANYVLVKRVKFQEKGTVLAWTCLALSSVLWVIALVFFYQRNSDSESSPAASRAENSPCDFLYVFDEHDIWHLTSSFALFFFFVALLTMDDDLCNVPSKDISVT